MSGLAKKNKKGDVTGRLYGSNTVTAAPEPSGISAQD
jgi:hypothetical protein